MTRRKIWGSAACSTLALSIALGAAPALWSAPAAAADTPAVAASAPVVLVLGSLPDNVDVEVLRARLHRELGTSLLDAPPASGPVRGTLHLRTTATEATARFEAPDGNVNQRSVPLPIGKDRILFTLVVLAGNVARDEAKELLAELARRKPKPSLAVPAGSEPDGEPAPATEPTPPQGPSPPQAHAPHRAPSPPPARTALQAPAARRAPPPASTSPHSPSRPASRIHHSLYSQQAPISSPGSACRSSSRTPCSSRPSMSSVVEPAACAACRSAPWSTS
ncbi:MAG: hypothetical protein R3F14_14610 [Polyangiaceae bacterium]